MDMKKLQGMTEQKAQDALKHCDPEKIAGELMKELDKNAKEAAKTGKRKARSSYDLYHLYEDRNFQSNNKCEGPLALISGEDYAKACAFGEIILERVKEHILDKEVVVELGKYRLKRAGDDCSELVVSIDANLSW
ncbi:MAG: hypothetical protein FWB74_09700 [Defluviitaleaceae bacterium]|nr:hypothetical protein [Defluviitaleaceae bacterium]